MSRSDAGEREARVENLSDFGIFLGGLGLFFFGLGVLWYVTEWRERTPKP